MNARHARRRGRRRAAWRFTAAATALGTATVGGAPATAATAAPATPAATRPMVTLGGPQATATATAQSLGTNTAAWDGEYLDADIPQLLRQARLGLVRYPGGSYADDYYWQTNSAYGQPQSVDFDQFSAVTHSAGAASFVTANYGSDTPQDAAAWVRYARQDPADQVALWEVGNEVYGSWETDQYPDPTTPQSYATYALPYLQQMHQADPAALVGVPYGLGWDQASGSGIADPAAWNSTVLGQDGRQIDFVDTHWYPFYSMAGVTDGQILASATRIPAVMASIRRTLGTYDRRAFVVVGETNISSAAVPQNEQPVAALFAAATDLEWVSQGARSVDWWDVHNYGSLEADFGLLSSGTGDEPPADTPLAAYDGEELASLLTTPGSQVSTLEASSPSVLAFVSRRPGGSALLLVNTDTSAPVTVGIGALGPGATVRTYTYGRADPQIRQATVPAATLKGAVTLPPESITALTTGGS